MAWTAEQKAKHPREGAGAHYPGRFAKKDGPSSPRAPRASSRGANSSGNTKRTWEGVPDRLKAVPTEGLAVAFKQIWNSPDSPGRTLALDALDAELARREGVAKLTADIGRGDQAADDRVAAGGAYDDLDPTELDAKQRAALVDTHRRPGERREQTIRRMYAEHVYLSWLDAEEITRGHLLNAAGKAKGIDPASLWSGPSARARKYASDELKQWWEDHGGRRTFAEYRVQYVNTGAAKAAASKARASGQGKDYGV